jgi:hypothetical protein
MPRRRKERPIPLDNRIVMFFNCRRCYEEMPPGVSPRDWARLEAGWTEIGFQVWCVRHDINLFHVDFEGKTHPASTHAEKEKMLQ